MDFLFYIHNAIIINKLRILRNKYFLGIGVRLSKNYWEETPDSALPPSQLALSPSYSRPVALAVCACLC